MNVEDLRAELRPRSGWEAVDLGLAMSRRWWRTVWLGWLTVFVPTAVLACLLFGPFWGPFVVWWLLPLLDRLPLFVLSRALFGATPSAREILAFVPKALIPNPMLLTLHRLDPLRSFHAPVRQLEGLRRAKAVIRRRRLREDIAGIGFSLVLSAWLAVLAILVGVHILCTTGFAQFSFQPLISLVSRSDELGWIESIGYLVGIAIIEPFYVGAGFGLYLNRRNHLEGWDIELVFRRLARRLARAATGVLPLLLTCGFAFGQNTPSPPGTDQDPQQVMQRVLEDDEFATHKKVERRVLRRSNEDDQEGDTSIGGDGGCAANVFGTGIGFLGIAFLVVALIAIVVAALRQRSGAKKPDKIAPPKEVAGLDIRPESLPADIPAAALAAWHAGRTAEALSLLYRGALSFLVTRRELSVTSSFTEGDCTEAVRRHDGLAMELRGWFASLTGVWTACAYAHRDTNETTVRDLCAGYAEHCGGPS